MNKKINIEWEDEDFSFEDDKQEDRSEFQNLFESDSVNSQEVTHYKVGDKVKAMIVHLPKEDGEVMLELGIKDSGSIPKQELLNEEGEFPYKLGDYVEAFIISKKDGEFLLSQSLSHKVTQENALEDAYRSQIPVKGKVQSENKGGYEVSIFGKKAFCPYSQMDLSRAQDSSIYLGKEFDFLIQKMGSRDLVVSRSAFLKRKAKEVLRELSEGQELDGLVKELRSFGAMVDLGGLVGMLHISEVSYGHLTAVSDVLSVGQKIRVKVLSIENQGGDSLARISLSRKQAQGDPWLEISEKIKVGESYQGKVVRLTNFGAFIEIFPGIDGLIHLSEMSWVKRVTSASQLLSLGDMVTVRVLELDTEKRRLSLSLRSLQEDPWLQVLANFKVGKECELKVQSLKSFGALVELVEGVTGLVPSSSLKKAFGDSFRRKASPPQSLRLKIARIDELHKKVLLTPVELDDVDESQKDYEEYLKQSSKKADKKESQSSMGSFGHLLAESMKKKRS